jgi:hypothetical protein
MNLFFEELLGFLCLRKMALQVNAVNNSSLDRSAAGNMGYPCLPSFSLRPYGDPTGFDASVHVSATPSATLEATNIVTNSPLSLLHSSSFGGLTAVTPQASDFQSSLPNEHGILVPMPNSPTTNARRSIDFNNPLLSLAPTPNAFPGSPMVIP